VIGFTPRILKEDPKSLVRFDHVACRIVNANHSVVRYQARSYMKLGDARLDKKCTVPYVMTEAVE
jgi:hypothetical protein